MKFKISKMWCEASAKKEGNASVGAGLPSVLGLSKIKTPAKRVRSGRLVRTAVPVGVVRELTAIMERDSKDQGALASVAKKLRMKIESAKRQASADAYADIAFRLRLLTGDTTERQPPSNAEVCNVPPNGDKSK